MTKRICIECHEKAKNKSYYCQKHRNELYQITSEIKGNVE